MEQQNSILQIEGMSILFLFSKKVSGKIFSGNSNQLESLKGTERIVAINTANRFVCSLFQKLSSQKELRFSHLGLEFA